MFAAIAAASAQASSGYVIEQRAANSSSRLILAPSGLRFDYYQPVRKGGRLQARRPKPLVGLIIHYRDARLFLLDPVHRLYQALQLLSAISSYESELKVLQRAQPSVKLPPRPGSKPRKGQAPLTPPGARLRRLALSMRIGPVRAQAFLLTQGHTSPALALAIYAQAMCREDGERERLRALVQGDYRALTGTEGELPVASTPEGIAA